MAPQTAAVPAAAGTAAAGAPEATPDYSTTNDQEAGVDEPDMVKTDGQLMVILRQQPLGLQVVDVSAHPPVLDGFLPLAQLGQADGLFLVGQDAVVIGGQTSWPSPAATGGGGVPHAARASQPGPLANEPPGAQPRAAVGAPPVTRVNPGGPMVPAPASTAVAPVNPGGPMVPAPKPTSVPTPAISSAMILPFRGAESSTDAVVVSLADPAAPSVVRTFSFQGSLQGARLINGEVVLALTSQPGFSWVYPAAGTPAAVKAATAANKAIIESSAASDWLPAASVKTGQGRATTTHASAPACAHAYHPVVSSGLGTVSIASFDPTANSAGNEVTVLGDAQNVYASATQIYVATTNWRSQGRPCPEMSAAAGCCPLQAAAIACCPVEAGVACLMHPATAPAQAPVPRQAATTAPVPPKAGTTARVPQMAGTAAVAPQKAGIVTVPEVSTSIYGFDITNPATPRYLGSGQVPGTLIGQYAMSEDDGYLRVATTVGEPTPAPADGGQAPAELSDNMVSVLQPANGALVTVGALQGLGQGEKIYAVLFQGDLGYVVTFNQLDPLYVVDLSHPDHPALAGQVSLSGYSSLLQPLGNGLLAGVGQSVGSDLQAQGLQLEVFDVSDPGQPTLVSRQALGDGASSAAEYDPHALLWWPQSDLLVLPVDDYSGTGPSSTAEIWSVNASGTLSRVGTLTQPQPSSSDYGLPEIERAVVVGIDIYTISEQGVMASDMSSLAQLAWLPFQGPRRDPRARRRPPVGLAAAPERRLSRLPQMSFLSSATAPGPLL